jgi:hypothetical protein
MQVGVGLALGTGGLLFAPTPSGAASAAGAVQLRGTPAMTSGRGGGAFVFTGAIGDSGKSIPANSSGKPEKKGPFGLLVLKGTILVNTTQLKKDLNNPNSPPTTFNTTTCSGHFSVTDPVPIVSGTKLYAGISGS